MTNHPSAEGVVLVADDDHTVLRLGTTILASAGFRPAVAENGFAALATYGALQQQIVLVIADVVMPASSGLELASQIVELNPAAKILLMSGYSDSVLEVEARKRFPFIRKPFLAEELLRKVREVLGEAKA
jgi:DNA-binding NtrC family response regulator